MKKIIRPKQIWDSGNRYAQGIISKPDRLLFIAGQTAIDGKGQTVGKGNIETQTRAALKNIEAIVEHAGGSRKNLVATTSYITDAKHLGGLQIEAGIFRGGFANQHHRHS
jgi:enamine deaminase RidA (YjgF/YER057c/UK114 family)